MAFVSSVGKWDILSVVNGNVPLISSIGTCVILSVVRRNIAFRE